MIRLYLPYIVGSKSPIPYLFEKIIPKISNDFFEVVTFTNKKDDILDIPNVSEIFVGNKTSVSGAIRFRLKYPLVSLQRFDLIHTGGRAPSHARMAQLARRRNSEMAHLHTLRIDPDPKLPQHTANKQLVEMADKVTAVSKHTAQTAKNILGIKPRVIYNGVDMKLFNPNYKCPNNFHDINMEKPIFLFVGALEDRKRPKDIIEVAKNINKATFVMIGDGDNMDQIKRLSRNLDNVKILGRLDKLDLPPIYANANGLVFPSIREGCPNVVMEAMASGLPVVGYKATSMPELVNHMQTGYLAEPCDTSELAEGVEFVMSSKKNMGGEARSYVKSNHSFDKIAKEYSSIYNEIL